MTVPWVLERRTDGPPQTTNDFLRSPQEAKAAARKHHKDHATVAEWREWAGWQPKALGWDTVPGVVEIEHWSLRVRAWRIDTGAHYLLGKALVDGLVDAKFLSDDEYRFVAEERLKGPLVVGYYGIRLVIREIEGVTLPLQVARPAGRVRTATRRTRKIPSTLTGETP
jgi:hypothetical protein